MYFLHYHFIPLYFPPLSSHHIVVHNHEYFLPLAQLSAGFQSLPPLTVSKLSPSGAGSQIGRLVYVVGPCGLSNELSCEAGSFPHHCNPYTFLQPEALRLPFPTLEPWVAWSVSLPSCSSWFIHIQMWDHQLLPYLPSPSASHHLVVCPLCPSCPSPPLLPVRMTVSSLIPSLSDFHIV